MKIPFKLVVPLLLSASFGCATTQSRFNSVYPGMPSRGVVETMEGGPSRAQEFGDGSTAWYYGDDFCLLLRDDKVVAKDSTQEKVSVNAGVVALKEVQKAQCAPPGTAEVQTEQMIRTPVGSFKGSIDPEAIKNKARETRDALVGDSVK
ncbi:hypothetical protein [Melittangium boletus]|uniref:Lipoprotein n=1 Tax=Melittangium boletus DSM 14713 TaxID=1294270 RepID=A0A250IML1_9BACT|nr:hypothetical protein [Melittangium boletus]ATB32985.1 hypothetical protein MEBOL_006474 [Melittangium boletus DSM 14713]